MAFGLLTIYLAGAAWFDGFVFARCLEGLAQGTFFVCSVMTMLTLFPPKLRGIAYSVFGVTSLSGAASGAFIGGWFLGSHAFWRDAMLTYALSAMFVGIVIWTLLEAPGAKGEARFDVPGIAFVFVAFLSYQYIAAFGERRDWLASPDIVAALLLAFVGFGLFIWRELCENRCGFIQLRLFNIRNLTVASMLGFGLSVPLFGANQFVQYTQVILGFPPSTAGGLAALRVMGNRFCGPRNCTARLSGQDQPKGPNNNRLHSRPRVGCDAGALHDLGLGTVDVRASHRAVRRRLRLPLHPDREPADSIAAGGRACGRHCDL